MKILFTNNISEIRVFEKYQEWDNSYYIDLGKKRVGTRFFIFPIYEKVKGLFYYYDDNYYCTIEEYNNDITKRKYIEDGKFYHYPHCTIYMNSGEKHDVYFKTKDELYDYVNELKKGSSHIEIK